MLGISFDSVSRAVKTKLYIQIYDTITKGLLSNPRKRRKKLVMTNTVQTSYDTVTKALLSNNR